VSQENYQAAIDVYKDSLESVPERERDRMAERKEGGEGVPGSPCVSSTTLRSWTASDA